MKETVCTAKQPIKQIEEKIESLFNCLSQNLDAVTQLESKCQSLRFPSEEVEKPPVPQEPLVPLAAKLDELLSGFSSVRRRMQEMTRTIEL